MGSAVRCHFAYVGPLPDVDEGLGNNGGGKRDQHPRPERKLKRNLGYLQARVQTYENKRPAALSIGGGTGPGWAASNVPTLFHPTLFALIVVGCAWECGFGNFRFETAYLGARVEKGGFAQCVADAARKDVAGCAGGWEPLTERIRRGKRLESQSMK